MSEPYTVAASQKMQFAGIYLLEYMINHPKRFSVLLQADEEDLESILEWLLVRDYVEIKEDNTYLATSNGQTALKQFMARYSDFLNVFDIYCAVDLGLGEFAFASYFDDSDQASWKNFLAAERWEDMRVAVAQFKAIDPVEIVFMSFLNENRFGRDQIGWQFDLLLGSVWDDILNLCNTAVQVEQLSYESEAGIVTGESVMEDIINQGTDLFIELKNREAQLDSQINHLGAPSEHHPDMVDPVDFPNNDSDYYQQYNAPDYRPPHWQDRWRL
ncbi:MAG: hypothetical protein ACI8Z5_001543 [Lentimonas sp.]|jgi:hypothetical protein